MAKAPAKTKTKHLTVDDLVAGEYVVFLGYGEGAAPEEGEPVLEEGVVYPINSLPAEAEDEQGAYMTGFYLRAPNPDFDESKRENKNSNPRYLELEAMGDEIRPATDEEIAEAGEEVEQEEAAPAPAKPAAKTAAKTPAKPAAKTAAKGKAAAAEDPPAEEPKKPVAKKPTAAERKKAEAEAKAAEEAAARATEAAEQQSQGGDADGEELENEDPAVLALVADGNLIAVAAELESEIGNREWELGGVLHHIHVTKAYLDETVEGHEQYAESGGFKLFLQEYYNIDYRKAMNLIQIYREFTKAGIENPGQRVAEIGWTKAAKIAPKIAEGGEAEDLIELASTNSVKDLSLAITEHTQQAGTGEGERLKYVSLKFRFPENDAAIVNDALTLATEQLGLADDAAALMHILSEWSLSNAPTTKASESAHVEDEDQPATPAKGKGRTKVRA